MRADERFCKICNENLVEDELHFLFVCTKYANERRKLFDFCNFERNLDGLNDREKLNYVMNQQWRYIAKYINVIYNIRKNSEFIHV